MNKIRQPIGAAIQGVGALALLQLVGLGQGHAASWLG